jgi:hypothetical protein
MTCAHDWARVTGSSPTDVTLTCRRCGAASVSRGKMRGRTVTTTLDLFPPRGATMLQPDVYEFFIRQWEAECAALAQTGYTVDRRPPVLHTQAMTGTPNVKQRSGGVTGRDLVLAAAIVLLGGCAMLVAGIYLHVQWLAVAGGVALGILFLLLLLIVHLS